MDMGRWGVTLRAPVPHTELSVCCGVRCGVTSTAACQTAAPSDLVSACGPRPRYAVHSGSAAFAVGPEFWRISDPVPRRSLIVFQNVPADVRENPCEFG